jgi:HTH-type transcriptional regulator / antitoxin HigA
MKIKPIKSDTDLEAAHRRIGELWDREDQASRDELDVLAALVHAYEEVHHPIEPVDAIEAIKFRMEQAGLTQLDLAKLIGRSRASEVLSHRRALSLRMIRTLHDKWQIPLGSLVLPIKVKRVVARRSAKKRRPELRQNAPD